ncbi:hypothetical protein [Rubrivirga sp.]|uniref:hypothetical protein n=1 Tax=Rubrivirga sp. TaxID=1885344 RepID=UPI003B51AB9B
MRGLALVVALSLASAAGAQPEDDPVPDPTPPHLYYPLAVGNVWEYANLGTLPTVAGWHTRREIVRDTVVDGQRYFVELRTRIGFDWEGWKEPSRLLVRYDSASTRVMLFAGGTVLSEYPITCRLGLDFGGPSACDGFSTDSVYVGGETNAEIPFGYGSGPYGIGYPTGTLEVSASKVFYTLGLADYNSYPIYAAPVGYAGEDSGCCARSLTYARVLLDDGTIYEVGAQYDVASDDGPETGRLALAVGPNPTAGPLALALDVPAPATLALEAFDALGRRVWQSEVALGSGRHRVEVDAGRWAPGLYVVRATGPVGTATATVVRR